MKKRILKQGMVGLLAGICIALGSAGCTEGTWYVFGNGYTKNPKTGKMMVMPGMKPTERIDNPLDYSSDPPFHIYP